MWGKIARIWGMEINLCSVSVLRGFEPFKEEEEGEEHRLRHLKRMRRVRSIP